MLNTNTYKTALINNLKRLYKLYFNHRSARLEKKNFSERIRKARSRVKKFFFITGAPKSGTTWLCKLINAHPHIVATAEAAIVSKDYPSIDSWFCEERFRSWTELEGVKYGSGLLNNLNQTEFVTYIKRSMIEAAILAQWKPPTTIIGDKTPLLYCQKPEELKNLFPTSKFINIIRDGRDVVVSSHFHLLRTKDFSYFKNPESGEQIRQCFVEGKKISCELFDEKSLPAVADVWAESVSGGRRAKGIFGHNYYEIKYENLLKDPMIIKDIFKFLGVSTSGIIAKHCVDTCKFERLSRGRERGQDDPNSFFRKGIVGDWKNYLDGKYKEIYKELNGQLLIEFGYEKDNDW